MNNNNKKRSKAELLISVSVCHEEKSHTSKHEQTHNKGGKNKPFSLV